MGKAILVKETPDTATVASPVTPTVHAPVHGPKMKPVSGPPKKQAGKLYFDDAGNPLNSRTQPAPAAPEVLEDETVFHTTSTRAQRVFEEPPDEEPVEPSEPEQEGDYTDEELKKLKELKTDVTSPAGKAYIHAQRLMMKKDATINALQAQVTDVLSVSRANTVDSGIQPIVESPDVKALQAEIDAEAAKIGSTFLDDMPGNIKKLIELGAKKAKADLTSVVQAKDEKLANAEAENHLRVLLSPYPGLIKTKADAAYVDAYAVSIARGQAVTDTHIKESLDYFAKIKGWTAPAGSVTTNADVERMKTEAAQVAPVASSVKTKGKTWRQSELADLQIKYPEKYRSLQKEIMRAYSEGRVVRG